MTVLLLVLGGVAVAVLVAAFLDAGVAAALLVGLAFTRACAVSLHSENLAPAVLAVVLGTAAWARSQRTEGSRTSRTMPFVVAMFAYLALVATSSLWANDSHAALSTATQLALIGLLCIGVIAAVRDTRSLRLAVWAIMWGGIALAAISLHQAVTGAYGNSFGGFAVAQVENLSGVTNGYRIGGPFGDPNFFGQLMVVPVAFALEHLVAARSASSRVFAFAVVVACSATIALTYSRGALFALVAVIGLTIWSMSPAVRRRILVATIAMAAVGLLFAPGVYRDRILQVREVVPGVSQSAGAAQDPALLGRTSALIVGWRMFVDHPVVGVGAANFTAHYLDYATDVGLDHSGTPLEPHNLILQVASETGLVGLVIFGLIIGGAFIALGRSRRAFLTVGRTRDARLIVSLRNALLGYFIASIFLHAAFPQWLWVLLALAWATPQCADRLQVRPKETIADRTEVLVGPLT